MKISTWNLMRPNAKTGERNTILTESLHRTNADILIITETNSLIDDLGDKYFKLSTTPLPKVHDGYPFQPGENRVTILSKYPFIKQITTGDEYTNVCAEVASPFGNLIIYGTMIGFLGGMHVPFESDLEKQTLDFARIVQMGNVCISGDINVSFSGFPHPSYQARQDVNDIFNALSLKNLTGHFKDSVIHTIMNESFLADKKIETSRSGFDKKVSDHSLINVIISEK